MCKCISRGQRTVAQTYAIYIPVSVQNFELHVYLSAHGHLPRRLRYVSEYVSGQRNRRMCPATSSACSLIATLHDHHKTIRPLAIDDYIAQYCSTYLHIKQSSLCIIHVSITYMYNAMTIVCALTYVYDNLLSQQVRGNG